MNKLFKPRTMRRICLLLALMFPLVYLMGSLFFVLNGSHGNQLVAQNQEESSYNLDVEIDGNTYTRWVYDDGDKYIQFDDESSYLYVLSPLRITTNVSVNVIHTNMAFDANGECFGLFDGTNFYSEVYGDYYLSVLWYKSNTSFIESFEVCSLGGESFLIRCCEYDSSNGSYQVSDYDTSDMSEALSWFDSVPWQANITISFGATPHGDVWTDEIIAGFESRRLAPLHAPVVSTPTDTPISYSDYLFSQPFAENNFVSKLGKDVLTDDVGGFAPVGDLLRWVDGNVLHFGVDDRLALFGYGYVYYAVNVLIVYEVIVIASSLLMLPLKVVDKLDRERSE